MSSGNESLVTSVANIALPPQTISTVAHSGQVSNAANGITTQANSTQYSDYYASYSSPEYQQYCQQYYAAYTAGTGTGTTNDTPQTDPIAAAYAQHQYAAYYPNGTSSIATDPSTTALYGAMYGQAGQSAVATNGYLTPQVYQTLAAVIANKQDSTSSAQASAEEDEDDDPTIAKPKSSKASNTLPYHCNEKMGLNPLIYTNIQQSPYFKNNLFQLKTYHEVIDEIYYNVKHLEPWERGSRKHMSGQTGMCGSVRGVGAGGIISTPFCILYKLYTLRLTRKQLNGLIRHKDSAFIRGLGFLFIRYTQPPKDLWQWFEPFLDDEEEVDPKAGGGMPMTVGQMVRSMLTKLEWFSTLFPRIPIPIQKEIEKNLQQHDKELGVEPVESLTDNKDKDKTDSPYHKSSSSKYYSKSSSFRSRDHGHSSRSRSRSRSPSSKYQVDRKRGYKRHDNDDRDYNRDRRGDHERDRSSNRYKSGRY